MSDDVMSIVIDNGTYTCKVGFGELDSPSHIIPTVMCQERTGVYNNKDSAVYKDTIYIGDDAIEKKNTLNLNYPIAYGVIENWDDMEKIWHQIFHDVLYVVPETHPVLLTEPTFNPKENREKMMQIMFEKFHVPSLYIANQAVLSLYSNARVTGVVLETGDAISQVVPIQSGQAIVHAMKKINIGGSDITDYLSRILPEKGSVHKMNPNLNHKNVNTIKEKIGCVAVDFNQEMSNMTKVNYQLPDGQIINVGNKRFRCTEVLFQPSLVGCEKAGVHKMIFNAIKKCDVALQKQLYSNIIISGGSSMFPGFDERLEKEITALSSSTNVKINAKSDRKYHAWIGGSLLTSLSSFQSMWVTKQQYQEIGPAIVHRKCT